MTKTHTYTNTKHKEIKPFTMQLLKWVGNKQRFAHEIIGLFPEKFNYYHEPFLGSGAILATISPLKAYASDAFLPLIEIFQTLKDNPDKLKKWYEERWVVSHGDLKKEGYNNIKKSYNSNPNAADFLFLCRSCYGGVIRFRKKDGFMSTPCGPHEPINPTSFNKRVDIWHKRVENTEFRHLDYKEALQNAKTGDLVYCDPPYHHSQAILYGGQEFRLAELFEEIVKCKERGVYVALSIDGTKKSGNFICDLPIPVDLFEEEIFVNIGKSMLKRFQMEGKTLEDELVSDRLLLTYSLAHASE